MVVEFFDWLTVGQKVLAFVLMAFGALAAIGKWFWGRVGTRVDSGVSKLTLGHESIEKRLLKVEGSVVTLSGDIDRVRSRLTTIDATIGQLATSKDLHALSILVAQIGATSEAQANTLRMLYEAAMRAEKGAGK